MNWPVFCAPSARPAQAGSGHLGHRGEGEAVVGDRHRDGDDKDDGRRSPLRSIQCGEHEHDGDGRPGDPAERAHAAAHPVAEHPDADAADRADELGGSDEHAGGERFPVQLRDQPDQAERGQRELGHDEQDRHRVDAPQEAAGAVGVRGTRARHPSPTPGCAADSRLPPRRRRREARSGSGARRGPRRRPRSRRSRGWSPRRPSRRAAVTSGGCPWRVRGDSSGTSPPRRARSPHWCLPRPCRRAERTGRA